MHAHTCTHLCGLHREVWGSGSVHRRAGVGVRGEQAAFRVQGGSAGPSPQVASGKGPTEILLCFNALAGVARERTGGNRGAAIGRGGGGVAVAEGSDREAVVAAGGGSVIRANVRNRVAVLAAGGGGVAVAVACLRAAVVAARGGGVVVALAHRRDAV